MEHHNIIEAGSTDDVQQRQYHFANSASELQQQICGKKIKCWDQQEERYYDPGVSAVGQCILKERNVADNGEKYIIGGNECAAAYKLIEF